MKDRVKVEDLLTTSDLQVRSAATAWKHVQAEYVDIVDDILATLAPSGPYAYTVVPEVAEGKEIPNQRIVTTYDDIERKGDVDSIVEKAHPEIQTGVRDYVAQTGTLVNLHTNEDLRAYLQDFYAQYSVLGIEVVTRHFDDWYFFHELRWTVESKKGPTAGSIFRYHTAEYAEVTPTGLLTAHIGHGTDQLKLS